MNIKNRLEMIEAKMNPVPEKSLIIRITRAGREDNPVSWRNHTTNEIYHQDSDMSDLKGVNVLMAVYSNGD